MANLTISIDPETLKRARMRALQENTSVNALLRDFLVEYANLEKLQQERRQALQELLEIAQSHSIDRGERSWNREELYER
jgi:predicted HicB family RNase H-like nuclease